MFNLVCEAPHSRSKAGHDNRGINRRSSIGQIVGLNVALIICVCQEVNVIGAIAGGVARVWRITQGITIIGLLP